MRIMTKASTVLKENQLFKQFPFKCIRKQGQPRIIIWANLVGPTSIMLHTKSRGDPPPGSGKKILKGFYHIWKWRPSWSCDQDYFFKLSFPHPKKSAYEI